MIFKDATKSSRSPVSHDPPQTYSTGRNLFRKISFWEEKIVSVVYPNKPAFERKPSVHTSISSPYFQNELPWTALASVILKIIISLPTFSPPVEIRKPGYLICTRFQQFSRVPPPPCRHAGSPA